MKTVIIVDDEQDARELLKEYLSHHEELTLIGEASNGFDALLKINSLKPDVIFLDIQMPGLDGFEVLSKLEEIPEIIFSTAYDQFAIKAFEVHAVDYLLKPYGKKRFDNALARILKNQESLTNLAEDLLAKNSVFPVKIILHKGNRKIVVSLDDIFYGKAFGDYTKVFTKNENFLSVKGISYLIEAINPVVFIRIHRTHFINKNQLKEIRKIGRYYYAILFNEINIKISESYLPEIKKMIF